MSGTALILGCGHAKNPQMQNCYCPSCKKVLCQDCKSVHVSLNSGHQPAPLTRVLSDVISFYSQTAKESIGPKEPQSDKELAASIRGKIDRAYLLAQEIKNYMQSFIDGIVGEQLKGFEEMARSAEELAKQDSVDKEKAVKELVKGFAQNDYATLIETYEKLPELRANAERFGASRESIKKKADLVTVPEYAAVRGDIEKRALLFFQGFNFADANSLSADLGLLSACVVCKKSAYICACCKNQCSICKKVNFCAKCAYICGYCNVLHCYGCMPSIFHCPKCKKNLCGDDGLDCGCGCENLPILNEGQLCTFSQTSQFSSNNTSHWYPEKMIDPTTPDVFAFDGGRLGWVCWNMTGMEKRIKRLVYDAESGNSIAVEYSKDGTNFAEATRFLDDKPVSNVKIDVEGTFPYWRVRMLSSENQGSSHCAMWYY